MSGSTATGYSQRQEARECGGDETEDTWKFFYELQYSQRQEVRECGGDETEDTWKFFYIF
ncbi:hypothetical protein EYF80_020598 [Liparis tanakae]|uniref:Uncharacterized protein n=1 Tax=Liparis tanakae TaxID=230148 RepID=A0A4Z2HUA8_9TELE|nr:hypothetical protein EYF80_020598 [Liparis tanakae]